MSKFIELQPKNSKRNIYINVDKIQYIQPAESGTGTTIYLSNSVRETTKAITVLEDYETVKVELK